MRIRVLRLFLLVGYLPVFRVDALLSSRRSSTCGPFAVASPRHPAQRQRQRQKQRQRPCISTLATKDKNTNPSTNAESKSNCFRRWFDSRQAKGVSRARLNDLVQRSNLRKDFVVVLTGATGGIGSALCQTVLEMGGLVVAVDYDPVALDQLVSNLPVHLDAKDRVRPIVADFADLQSVAEAGRSILNQVGNIDILVNNAGIFYNLLEDGDETPASKQGYDLCLQINYLSHFLLTELLLPKLNHTQGGRIVQVTSSLHWGSDGSALLTSADQLCGEDSSNPIPAAARTGEMRLARHMSTAYGNSKLAQLWHAADLNRRQSGVTAVCACPSWAATGIAGPDQGGQATLDLCAFPTRPSSPDEIAGPALSSILNAMFIPTDELDPELLTSRKLIGNAQVLNPSGETKPVREEPIGFLNSKWIDDLFGGRALFCQTVARVVILPLQRFFHGELLYQPTSYECNHVQGQVELIQWSLDTVQEFMQDLDETQTEEQIAVV